MIKKINKFREYLDYIEEHYNNIQKAWKLINDKCQNKGFAFISDDNLWFAIDSEVKHHDKSKLSMQEFTQYRQFFFPCENEKKDRDLFKNAWEHHKIKNSHHWQTWTMDGYGNDKQVAFIHNLVDWIVMGFKFGDTARDYYENNKDEIKLPKWAVKLMYEIFDCIY